MGFLDQFKLPEPEPFTRLSSTSLSTWLRCKRRFAFGFVLGYKNPTSEAMDIGTVFHAAVEYYLKTGRRPAAQNIAWMNGNYERPVEAMTRTPSAFKVAREMLDYEEFSPEDYVSDSAILEFDTEEWGLTSNGIDLGGYIDVFDPALRRIGDWKSRGNFNYAPVTFEDFMENIQLCYYGGLAVKALGWKDVTIEHINVKRPGGKGPRLLHVEHTFPASYMLDMYEYVDKIVLPEMLLAIEQIEENHIGVVEPNWAHCWQFGRCPFMDQCPAAQSEDDDFFSMDLEL